MRNQKPIYTKKDHLLVYVKVIPASSETKVVKLYDNRIVVKVQAIPEKGKANSELISFFSKLLEIHKKSISIMHGESSRLKTLCIPLNIESRLKEILKSLSD